MAAARTSIVAAALPIAFLVVTTITFDRFNGEVPGPYMVRMTLFFNDVQQLY